MTEDEAINRQIVAVVSKVNPQQPAKPHQQNVMQAIEDVIGEIQRVYPAAEVTHHASNRQVEIYFLYRSLGISQIVGFCLSVTYRFGGLIVATPRVEDKPNFGALTIVFDY